MTPRTILISGASSGLGAALALQYATSNVNLYLTARNAERLNAVATDCREKGATVDVETLNINDTTRVEKWIGTIAKENKIDLMIANAGVLEACGPGRTLESTENALNQINTNLGGCMNMVSAVAPFMQKERSGQIALIASLAGLQPLANLPAYSASKAGLIAYGEALHGFLGPDGITVSTLCPGFITTQMTAKNHGLKPFEMSAETAAIKIRKALEKKRVFYAFPWPLALTIKLGRLVPAQWRNHTTKAFDFRH